MRSSIFLVVPFAAVALGQIVRFPNLIPFPPFQAPSQRVFYKYKYKTTYAFLSLLTKARLLLIDLTHLYFPP